MRSGQPMIDKEEFVLDAKGNEKWLLVNQGAVAQ